MSELLERARVIHAGLAAHPELFGTLPLTVEAFAAQIADFKAKLLKRAGGGSAAVLALRAARADMEETLRALGQHVNAVARGRVEVIQQSGFPQYETQRPPDLRPPAPPEDLRLRHGKLSGTVLARYRPARRLAANEVQLCLGSPLAEEDWRTVGLFQGGKAELTGLPPGDVVWVRVRTAGLKGVLGAWSDPAQIRVL